MSTSLLWEPTQEFRNNTNLSRYIEWLKLNRGLEFNDYSTLWKWSVKDIDAFWKSLWEYFDIQHNGQYTQVATGDPMPFTKWFEGTHLNYAEHIFRQYEERRDAIIYASEDTAMKRMSWRVLRENVASLQQTLLMHGVTRGDRVVAYMPCIPEATVAFLATNGLGAIWSSCSPDFGTQAVIDRFAQIEPRVLIAVDSYRYNGKTFDKQGVVRDLVKAMPGLELVIILSDHGAHSFPVKTVSWKDVANNRGQDVKFTRVPFDHPIWILYSSGTTGLPKAITHSHGGVLLEQLKYCTFHNNFKPGEHCFWYTTTGWMMWNYIHGSLLTGSTMVLYDGSPGYPDLTVLWRFCAEAKINHFGTSAAFLLANIKAGIQPSHQFNLSALRSIGSTGSTLPPEGFEWVYKHVKPDLWLTSMSGGTDVCSAFVGGNPLRPVYSGEIQCRALGCSLEAWSEDGRTLTDEEGEMVITRPMPSMPVFFWNDPLFSRYRESYFDMYPGVWRHGDWIKVTPRDGIIISGRSDATLNRGGVRIGTSEIYRAVDHVPEVKDSLVVCIEKSNGEFWMPLFVMMKEGQALTDEVRTHLNQAIRSANSPRHVPDEIIEVPDVPYTISGKKTETPVKKVLMGRNPAEVINPGSLRNPGAVEYFVRYADRAR